MGFNTVSFYVFWGLLEPKQGDISFEGFRDLQPFFDAALKAGIYLIARPGPYINAEVTAGGFPGWSVYSPGVWRTSDATYYDAWHSYMAAVGKQIGANEITKGSFLFYGWHIKTHCVQLTGGPIILVQACYIIFYHRLHAINTKHLISG